MKGEGFEYLVKKGQHVKEGQPILKFDKAKIEAKGLNPVVVFVKTDEGNQTPVAFKNRNQCQSRKRRDRGII